MPTAAQMEAAAIAWQRPYLVQLWGQIKAKAPNPIPGWGDGKAFEYLIVRAFHMEAAQDTRWPYGVTIPQKIGTVEQIDGAVYVDDIPFLIESKDYGDTASIEAVAKMRFRLESRPPGMMGVLFSARNFTAATELLSQFAVPLNVLLWGAADLDKALPNGTMIDGLREKYRYAVERGWSNFPI
jgi:hypothetical protein